MPDNQSSLVQFFRAANLQDNDELISGRVLPSLVKLCQDADHKIKETALLILGMS